MSENFPPDAGSVSELQEMLRLIYYQSALSADGYFGEETLNAVKKFQKDFQMPVTGTADFETWDKTVTTAGREQIHKGCAEHLCIVLQPGQILSRGSHNVHLFLIQGILTAMAQYYDEMPSVHVNGILDEETQQALSWFQRLSGLPETGEVDKPTWKHLCTHYRLIAGDGSGTYPFHNASEK